MLTIDLKKQWKELYKPTAKEMSFVDVPAFNCLMADGAGDPNGSASFEEAIHALFSLSYTLKFMVKKGARMIDYGVMPLEGLWWADDPADFVQQHKKDRWKWTLLIVQPDFITVEDVLAARDELRRKKKDAGIQRVRLESCHEGPSAQLLYTGPYADEGPTVARMHEEIQAAGRQLRGHHHEIYLSDMRRTAPEKLKTILRQPVE
jgi:hypothetical protein